MKVNIRRISEMTGFSPATVSNALNHKKGVNPKTAALILETAKSLGYNENSKISRIRFIVFKKYGNVVEDTPFFPLMISGAEQECRACGMEMVLCNLDRREPEYGELFQSICEDRSAANILLGTELEDEDTDVIRKLPPPLVVIDYWKEDMSFDALLINNEDSARLATEYLIGKGHTAIGYLKGSFRIKPFRSRYSGYRIALEKAGLPVEERFEVTLGCTMDGACQDMKAFLETKPQMPTAFFSDNDMIALGAVKAMSECGIRVPEDVSVVGFDDLTYTSISSPPLTTIRVPKQEMGKVAVRRLNDMISDPSGVHLKMQVCTEFVERDSVRELKTL